jgi:hypothetical protein
MEEMKRDDNLYKTGSLDLSSPEAMFTLGSLLAGHNFYMTFKNLTATDSFTSISS